MILKNNSIGEILACPLCKGSLVINDNVNFKCNACNINYNIFQGIPIFTSEIISSEDKNAKKTLLRRIYDTIPEATTWTDETIFTFINQLPDDSIILNLGSGQGIFDNKINKKMINLDVVLNSRTDLVADGHFLPFKSESFDCVFSNAVLEHVKKPWVVAAEIERVIKPNGFIAINLPFLNTIHDEEDYFRFTLKGIRELFPGFIQVYGGVSSGGGSFLPLCTAQYISLFIPLKILKAAFYFIWAHVFFRLKKIDRLFKNNQDFAITANSFYFIGRKRKNS